MATVNKDFKVKSGLIVEGANGTINGFDILTKSTSSDEYIVDLIGGEAFITSVNNEFDVSAGGELSINRTTVDAYYDAAGSAGDVASDLTDHENATEAHGATGAVVGTTNTQTLTNKTISYTDNTLTVQVANVSDLTASASELNTLDGITASTAELNLLDGVTATTTELNYVDGVTSAIQDQLNAKAPLDAPALTGIPTAPTAAPGTNSTQIATTAYADAAVAALVDGAPELLDTLNELAAAINDDASFATTLTTSVGEKVSKSGDTMTGLLVLSADPSENLGAATKQYVDTAETDAVATAESYTDGEITTALTTAQGYADAAEAAAIAHADALTTDDVAEGAVNEYFTDARAKDAAADLLVNASQTNITITGTGAGLTITAENGVADSDTDDLTEGSTNLYFTDTRAVDALEAVVPDFTAVEINSIAKQVAATVSVPTAGIATAIDFLKADYRSAEFLVKVAYSTHTEVSKILLTLDTSDNIAITEYGIVGTNGSAASVSAAINGTKVELQVTTANNSSTVTVVGTLLA
jgi:hypothetical protein